MFRPALSVLLYGKGQSGRRMVRSRETRHPALRQPVGCDGGWHTFVECENSPGRLEDLLGLASGSLEREPVQLVRNLDDPPEFTT